MTSFGKTIANLLTDLGPFYQKIGQIMAGLGYLIPPSVADELKKFQEANMVDLVPITKVHELLRTHSHYDQIKHIDPDPIASGTVAQVHVGYLKDGTKIAVKIVKENVRERFRKNLKSLKRIEDLCKYFGYDLEYYLCNVWCISDPLVNQADLRHEYAMIQKMRQLNRFTLEKGHTDLPTLIGDPHPDIMLMRFIDAKSCGSYDWSQLSKEKRYDIADRVCKFIIDNSINDAIFHIDLHPGNIMYNEEEDKVYIIDFGLMGDVAKRQRCCLREFIAIGSELEPDPMKMAELYVKYLVDLHHPETVDDYKKELGAVMAPIFDKDESKRPSLIEWNNNRDAVTNKYGNEVSLVTSFNIALVCCESTIKTIHPEYTFGNLTCKNRF